MLDLIAVTAGVLSFLGWSAGMILIGVLNQRKRERTRQQREAEGRAVVQRLMGQRGVPYKREPEYPEPSTETIRRSQA